MTATARAVRVPLKSVALPNEHGAWGFLVEPALLGLLLAPSGSGALLVLTALAVLFMQHPLGLVLADLRRGRTYPRTRLAGRFLCGYGMLAAAGLIGAVLLARGAGFLLPALLAAPLALLQLSFDARNRGRALLPELAGATAIAALVAAIALAGGWALGPALALWILLATRNLSSIVYVRARLRLEYGRAVNRPAAVATQLASASVIGYLVLAGQLPALSFAGFLVLLVRALLGLSRFRRPSPAKLIGIRELGFGFSLVLSTAAGYLLQAGW